MPDWPDSGRGTCFMAPASWRLRRHRGPWLETVHGRAGRRHCSGPCCGHARLPRVLREPGACCPRLPAWIGGRRGRCARLETRTDRMPCRPGARRGQRPDPRTCSPLRPSAVSPPPTGSALRRAAGGRAAERSRAAACPAPEAARARRMPAALVVRSVAERSATAGSFLRCVSSLLRLSGPGDPVAIKHPAEGRDGEAK